MKIAYFIGSLIKEDGVSRVLIKMASAAKDAGLESVIVTGYVEDASISPVPIIEVPAITFPLYKAYKLPMPGKKHFETELDKFAPDIIHVHSPETLAFAALKYAHAKKIPIVATHHTDFVRYLPYYHLSLLAPALWFLFRRLYNRMNLVTTPSKEIAEELVQHGVRHVETLPWGTDLKLFNPKKFSESWRNHILAGKEGKIILTASRLTWEKNLKILAEAYRLLRSSDDKFAMVVAGSGPAAEGFKKLMPGAIFLGHLDSSALAEAYASSDIFLFPSATETFGNVTLEAMASGAVPIVADAGGSKSLVENGANGLVAQSGDAKAFYLHALTLLKNSQKLKLLRSAGIKFAQDYSWDKVFDRMFSQYQKLAGKD